MYLDQDVFLGLRGDLPFGVDLCPIEHTGMIVELAPGDKQFRFGERLTRLDSRYVRIDQALLCMGPSQGNPVSSVHLRTFVDVVHNIDVMRVGL